MIYHYVCIIYIQAIWQSMNAGFQDGAKFWQGEGRGGRREEHSECFITLVTVLFKHSGRL